MSLDLRLLPFDADNDIKLSFTVLSCHRRRDLFDRILALPTHQTPEEFWSFLGQKTDDDEESSFNLTTKDPYGNPLTYTTSEALLTLGAHVDVHDNFKNKAIWAYLKELPPKTKVALFWH